MVGLTLICARDTGSSPSSRRQLDRKAGGIALHVVDADAVSGLVLVVGTNQGLISQFR